MTVRTKGPIRSRAGGAPALLALALAAGLAGCGEDRKPTTKETPLAATVASDPRTPVAPAAPRQADGPARRVVPESVTYEEAEAAYRDRRYDEAVDLFAAWSGKKPANPWGHYMLGLSAWKAGLHERAIPALEKAVELDPVHVKALVNLSRVLLEVGRGEEALPRIESALDIDPASADAWRVAGNVRSELGRTVEAADAYRRAIVLDDRDAWSMNNLGLVLIREGRYEEALAPLARATELEPGVAVFRNNLGVALERTGHLAAAADAYRAAAESEEGSAKASVSLARVAGLGFDPDSGGVDLSALALGFQAEVEAWRSQPLAADPAGPGRGEGPPAGGEGGEVGTGGGVAEPDGE